MAAGKESGEKIRYAVFDADGTLLDSMGIWRSLGDIYLRKKGYEPPPGLWDEIKTMTLVESSIYFKEKYHAAEPVEVIMDEVTDIVRDFYYYEVQEKPGAVNYIRRLYEQGTRIAVATASERDQIEKAMARLGMLPYLENIFTCTELDCGKNTPEFWRLVARRLGTVPEELTVFEDALHAARTAVEAGCRVNIMWDASAEEDAPELQELGERYIHSFDELPGGICKVLSIAGSDCSGGAGIQADLKTMKEHGVYGMSAVTALTAQNTLVVRRVLETPADVLEEQLEAVFSDLYPDAVKIGMMPSAELALATARKLREYQAANVVIDPVMVSTSGRILMKEEARAALLHELFPLAALITPNLPEAEALSGISVCSRDTAARAAERILEQIPGECRPAVLIKGGHAAGAPDDYLWYQGRLLTFPGKRIRNPDTHGTGCVLSSAIACNLALGMGMEESVRKAKEYLAGLLERGMHIGHGNGPVIL